MKRRIIEGNYQGVSFRGCDLARCALRGNFTGADFTDAVLIGTDLREGIFQDAVFTGADVRGALLSYGTKEGDRL